MFRFANGNATEVKILLARFFETTPEFWMNLQSQYDLWIAKQELASKNKI